MAEAEDILINILEKVAEEEKLNNCRIDLKPVSTEGANFLSILYKASLLTACKRDLKLFAKIAILPEVYRQHVPVNLVYEAEVSAYTKILPTYELLQDKYDIDREERFMFPKYYASSLVDNEETIILEDLTAHGYSMYDRFKPVTFEYATKAVEELAKFHALSIAFKNDFPDDYSRDTKQWADENIQSETYEMLKKSYKGMAEVGIKLAPKQIRPKLQQFINKHWEKEEFDKYYGMTKWGFIVHGDYRASNIMFKRQSGEIKHFIPVDYQAIHLGSPCVDLIYFIFSGTDVEFRRIYLRLLLDKYYDTLSGFLTEFNIDPEETFSRKEFDEEFKDKLAYGLSTTLALLPVLLTEGNHGPDGKTANNTMENDLKVSEEFHKRFLPVLQEFINWGIINSI